VRLGGRDWDFLANRGSGEGLEWYPAGVMQELHGIDAVLRKGYVEGTQRLQFNMIKLRFSQ